MTRPKAISFTRRGILVGAGGAAAGALGAGGVALASGSDQAGSAKTNAATVPFHGRHQAGIATPLPGYAQVLSLDLTTSGLQKLGHTLATWTASASGLTSGRPGSDREAELFALGPSSLTITVGFGPALFDKLAIGRRRPQGLAQLPPFSKDALVAAWTGGDVVVQVGADDPLIVAHVARRMVGEANGTLRLRWIQRGFSRPPGAAPVGTTVRNLMGQLDGSGNQAPGTAGFDKTVWCQADTGPGMAGGSLLVVRRIRMKLRAWDTLSRAEQERVIGRRKGDGGALGSPPGAKHEHDSLQLGAQNADGSLQIPADAHIRLAAPQSNFGSTIFRRPFSYDDGILPDGTPDTGQLFLAWQADPRSGVLPIQARLDEGDALNDFITHVGSAVFAVPRGSLSPSDPLGHETLGL